MIPVMYGQSEMCMATVVFYTCILLPLARVKQRLVLSSATLLANLFGYRGHDSDRDDHHHGGPPAVSADEWLEVHTTDSDPFTSSSSCCYEDEQDRVVSSMKRLLAAEAATYRRSSEEEEEGSCSICLGELIEETSSSSMKTTTVGSVCRLSRCKHVFHLDCMEKWVERDHFTCPLCRNFIVSPYGQYKIADRK